MKTLTKEVQNGINCSHPNLYICLNKPGLANLYPTINRMAAKLANGIIFKRLAIVRALNKRKKPCRMADIFVFAPKVILAVLRTITYVTGSPPIKPESKLPKPCALSSMLVGVILL